MQTKKTAKRRRECNFLAVVGAFFPRAPVSRFPSFSFRNKEREKKKEKGRYPRRERGINLFDVGDASMNTGASIL